MAFLAVSLLVLIALLPGAFLRGEVLGQAGLLQTYEPWRSDALARPGSAAPHGNPLLTDPVLVFQPLLTHTVASLREGRLPVWNAALYGGQPFIASFQTAVFSPFTAIALLVPLPYATVWMAIAPLLVGGIGMWRYLRGLGLSTGAAWFGGLAYLINTFAWVWLEHPLPAVACWLPWTLRAIDAVRDRGTPRQVATVAAFVALTILAGHPETAAKVLAVAVAYAAVGAARARRRRALPLAIAFAAGVLLTAVQVLPFVEYLSQSQALQARAAIATNRLFLPAATLITGLVPGFWGTPVDGSYVTHVNRLGFAANYAEQALYAGMAVVLLAPAGVALRRRDWRIPFFAAAGVLSLPVMFGLPGLLQVASHLPLVRVMFLSRFGLIAIVGAIVLASYAVDALTRATHEEHRRLARVVAWTAALVTLAIVAAWLAARPSLADAGLLGNSTRASALAIALLASTLVLVVLRSRAVLPTTLFASAACALVTADLVAAARGFHPTTPAAQVYPATADLDAVRRDRGLFRVYGWGTALPPDTSMAYGLQDARGWDGMNPYRYTRLLDLGYLRQPADPQRHLTNPILLDLLNVKYVFLEADLPLPPDRFVRLPGSVAPVYENRRHLPRAFLVDRYRVLDETSMLRAIHDGAVDLAREALLEVDLPPASRPVAAEGGPRGGVSLTHYRDTFVEAHVRSHSRALLVLADAYYPGWTATVDDVAAPLVRADFALRAVAVPAGAHVVRFRYHPWSLSVGAAISLFTVVAMLGAIWLERRRAPTASTSS